MTRAYSGCVYLCVTASAVLLCLLFFPTRRSSDLLDVVRRAGRAGARARPAGRVGAPNRAGGCLPGLAARFRSEEHTSELQSHHELVCRLLLEKYNAHMGLVVFVVTLERLVIRDDAGIQRVRLLVRHRLRRPPLPTLFPYTTLFRSARRRSTSRSRRRAGTSSRASRGTEPCRRMPTRSGGTV